MRSKWMFNVRLVVTLPYYLRINREKRGKISRFVDAMT